MARRPSNRLALVAAATGVLALLGVGARVGAMNTNEPAPVVDPQGNAIPTAPATPSKTHLDVVVSWTISDIDQRALLNVRLANIAMAAMKRKADVNVIVIGDAPDVSGTVVARGHFAGKCAETDNPECPEDTSLATTFVAEVNAGLDRLEPAEVTDIPGTLLYLARHRVELGGGIEYGAVLIGDGASSTVDCDFGLAPLNPSTFARTAERCLEGLQVDLGGTRVALAGVGRSADAANEEVLRATPGLLAAVITHASGTPRLIDLDAGPTGVFDR